MKRVVFYLSVLETFENLPYTEDSIHEYDVELIQKYLTDHIESHKKLVIDYVLKVVDNVDLESIGSKVKEICKDFVKYARSYEKENYKSRYKK